VSRGSRYLLLLAVLAVAFFLPSTARAHNSPPHWVQIQATSATLTYVDVFTGHCCFYMSSEATWSYVGDTCGYLHYIRFHYWNLGGPVYGGPAWVTSGGWNSNIGWPDSRGYYTQEGWSDPVWINTWICGGQGNGRLAATTVKHNGAPFCPDCVVHESETVWYR
jgi:hypothetical protein